MRIIHALLILSTVGFVQNESPSDYVGNKKLGKAYRIMYQARDWINAVSSCNQQNASLAVPESLAEFKFLQKLVRRMHYPSVQGADEPITVWLGVSDLKDYTVWRNINNGKDINTSGFHEWATGNGEHSTDPAHPHCVVIDAVNPGFRDFWCHVKKAYICQISLKMEN